MSGEEERHDLVADLPLGHAGALVVAREEQQREQVTAVLARSALADDPVDDVVEAARRAREASVPRSREPCRHEEPEAGEAQVVEVLDLGAEPGDLLDPGRDVGVEQRPGDDPERQRRHLVVEIDGRAVRPRPRRLSSAYRAIVRP